MASSNAPASLKKIDPNRRVSCETLCSSNSSCVLQKRKPLHPLATGLKLKSSGTNVRQRVLSAKVLRFKTLQNELNDANYHIAQLHNENKILKITQRKLDNALAKYEGTNAELPKVLDSHREEMRILQARNKIFRKNIKELNEQIKVKDEEITSLRDQNKHLTNLCKNKNLEEREKLSRKVEELQDTIKEREETISILNRKIALESKTCKFKISGEANKNRHLQRDLHKAQNEIEQLRDLVEGKEKFNNTRERIPVTDAKKQSLIVKIHGGQETKISPPVLDNKKSSTGSSISLNSNEDIEPCSSNSNHIFAQNNRHDITQDRDTLPHSTAATSEMQLKRVVSTLQKKKQDCTDSVQEKLNDYTSEIIEEAYSCHKTVDKHILEFEKSAKDTESLLSVLKENDEISNKLGTLSLTDKMTVFDYTDLFKDKNANVNTINSFSNKSSTSSLDEPLTFKEVRSKKQEVDNENKEKLLAKLRAIDNGENIEFSNVKKKTKNDLLKELFG